MLLAESYLEMRECWYILAVSTPMSSITVKLWRNYAVATITLWPVTTENCDVIMRNYDGKIVNTRNYAEKSYLH